jgi:hypothetical protein
MRRILSLDGGGMKGYVPTALVAEVERRTGRPCHEVFDMIAGTSIGGIIGLLLATGMPAAKALEFFTVDGPAIFKKHWWRAGGLLLPRYPSGVLEKRLKKRFGTLTLDDCKTSVLVPAYDLAAGKPVFFKNYGGSDRFNLWEVARATSAAETYFPAFKLDDMVLWDGGNEANNPALCAYADSIRLWGDHERVKVLSLGCGDSQRRYKPARLVNGGLIRNGLAAVEVLFDASSDVTDYHMRRLIGFDYYRIPPKFAEQTDLDDASPGGLATLKRNAQESAVRFSRVLDQFLR